MSVLAIEVHRNGEFKSWKWRPINLNIVKVLYHHFDLYKVLDPRLL